MKKQIHTLYLLIMILPPSAGAAETTCQSAKKYGNFITHKTPSPYIIAAPHGYFDLKTDLIADTLCKNLNWNCLIAKGFRKKGQRYNVNRPTQGARLASTQEKCHPQAQAVYQCYLSRLENLKTKGFRLYIEIHGNARKENQSEVQIAHKGLSETEQKEFKAILQKYLGQEGIAAKELSVKVQGQDQIHFKGTSAKKWGVYSTLKKGMMIELPAWVRKNPKARRKVTRALSNAFKHISF